MKRLLFLPAFLLVGYLAQTRTTLSTGAPSLPPPIPSSKATGASAVESKSLARFVAVPNGQTNSLGLTLPAGFQITTFAEGLNAPRRIAIVPNSSNKKGYDVAVSLSNNNQVVLLRDSNGDGKSDSQSTLLSGLNQPYGIEFNQGFMYVANTDALWKYPFTPGETKVSAAGKKLASFPTGGHGTRNLILDRTKTSLFVTVGSSCNRCEESQPERAGISQINLDGTGKHVVASGIRNPTGLARNPATSVLWTVVNERDGLGDDTPPDYFTSVGAGRFYGWPYAYTDINRKVVPDPDWGSKAPQKVAKTYAPDMPVQAHSAALGVAFYPLDGVKFPAQYRGDAFLAFHGSWNRSQKTGYKIVRVDFANGKPVGMSDFVTGFLQSGNSNWGRPVDIQVAPDGSLLFSDDQGGKIWRIAYVGTGPSTQSA